MSYPARKTPCLQANTPNTAPHYSYKASGRFWHLSLPSQPKFHIHKYIQVYDLLHTSTHSKIPGSHNHTDIQIHTSKQSWKKACRSPHQTVRSQQFFPSSVDGTLDLGEVYLVKTSTYFWVCHCFRRGDSWKDLTNSHVYVYGLTVRVGLYCYP